MTMRPSPNPAETDVTLLHRIEYGLVRLVSLGLRLLPRRAELWVAEMLGRLFFRVVAGRRRVAMSNLKAAFPEKSEGWRRKVAERSFASFGMTIADALYLGRKDDRSLFEYREEDIERLRRLFARGKGAVMVFFHYGNWEGLGALYSMLDLPPLYPVAARFSNPLVTGYAERLRTRDRVRVLFRRSAGREVVKALRGGGAIAVPCDVNTTPREGIFVDFLGLRTLASGGPARLALRYGVPLVISVARRLPDRRYLVRFDPVIKVKQEHDDANSVTAEVNRIVSGIIREDPTQYMWGHKRWKLMPPDADAEMYPYYARRVPPV